MTSISSWLKTSSIAAGSLPTSTGLAPGGKRIFKNPPSYPVRSLRNSSYGYVNAEDVRISFASLEAYVNNLEDCVSSGKLSAENFIISGPLARQSAQP